MRKTLEQIHPNAKATIEKFHPDFIQEVEKAIQQHPVVVVGMKQNPVVKSARKYLDAKGVKFHYIEHGSYISGWKKRLALKLWSGWHTFPQVFVKGQLIGGYEDLVKLDKENQIKL
jgi:glutaredoxin-related protein